MNRPVRCMQYLCCKRTGDAITHAHRPAGDWSRAAANLILGNIFSSTACLVMHTAWGAAQKTFREVTTARVRHLLTSVQLAHAGRPNQELASPPPPPLTATYPIRKLPAVQMKYRNFCSPEHSLHHDRCSSHPRNRANSSGDADQRTAPAHSRPLV